MTLTMLTLCWRSPIKRSVRASSIDINFFDFESQGNHWIEQERLYLFYLFIFLINVWSLVLHFSILNEPFKTDWSTFCVSGFARLSELGDQCSSCPSVADRSRTEDSKILFETFVCVTITTSLFLASLFRIYSLLFLISLIRILRATQTTFN